MAKPWEDRLARAQAPKQPAATRTGASQSIAPATRHTPEDLLQLAPGLQPLLAERKELEQRMQRLVRGATADPRYPVTPLAERRAELHRWQQRREQRRATLPTQQREPAPIPEPPLRPMATDVEPSSRIPVDATQWLAQRDAETRSLPTSHDRLARDREQMAGSWADLQQQLERDPYDRLEQRLARARNREQPRPAPSVAGRFLDQSAYDLLEQRLTRARDDASARRRRQLSAEQALARPRESQELDWIARTTERIPGVGRADPYVRNRDRKLRVDVGTLEEIGARADRLRAQASTLRELRQAEEAQDEARRERALQRLQERRKQEEDVA